MEVWDPYEIRYSTLMNRPYSNLHEAVYDYNIPAKLLWTNEDP